MLFLEKSNDLAQFILFDDVSSSTVSDWSDYLQKQILF